VTLPPGEECAVEASPLFQRPVSAVASYNSPPPFSPLMRGHFFVPYPPDGASEQEIQQRLENNSYASIRRCRCTRRIPAITGTGDDEESSSAIRRSFRTPYFTEGWGLYAEQVMREQASLPIRARRCVSTKRRCSAPRASSSIRACTWARCRSKRQSSSCTPKATCPSHAKAEVARYCAWPTQASAYLTGCLEIARIRERYFQERGGT